MIKKILLLILLTSPVMLFAQTYLTGNIYDNDNRATALESAFVKNLTTNALVLSNKEGHYVITAKIGDIIAFGMGGYETDTVYLTKLLPKNVYLRAKVNTLDAVGVTTAKISPFLDLRNPNAQPSRAVDYSKEKGGLRLNLGYAKFRRDQAKLRELEENEDFQEEITKNFNEASIKKLLKFEGPEVKDFMSLFRPTVDQVRAQRPFNYELYTAQSYRAWLKLPPSQRKLPPLPKVKTSN